MMPGKCFTWFVVCCYFLSIALPLNAQIFRQTQAAEQPASPQPQPGPAQPQAVPGLPDRTLLPPPSAPTGGMVSLNFNRADLVEIIHILAQHLRLTYTIDPEVKGTVTINSAEPLRTEDLLPIFHQVLRMNGAVAIKTGNVYRITPIKDAKGLARPMGSSKEDSFAIQIVPVRFFAVAEMKKLLTPFVMPGGEIIENPRGNFLVIVDLPSNIQRLMEIADLIDVQVFAGTRMEIYQPKVASAEELAVEMTKIMQTYASSVPQTETFTAQFVALPRINQLLVISHSEAAWTYAKRWLDRIDVIAEGPGRRIFVYPVENGKAIELADVLSKALGIPSVAAGGQTRTLESLHRSTTGGSTQPGTGRTTPPFGSSTPGFGVQPTQPFGAYAAVQVPPPPGQPVAPVAPPTAPGVPAPGLAPVPGVPRPPTPGAAPTPRPEEQVRIVADPATNSLIIYGTAQEFQNIKNILKELDSVPRQVLLDTLIAEVTLDDSESFGVDYEILRKGGDVRIFDREFLSRGAVLGRVLSQLGVANSAGISPFPTGVTGVIGTGNTVRALVNALMTDARFKILSSPSVLATDNRPARIQVGSEEPQPTGTLTAATGAITPSSSTTIQYRNTGRIVTIIPQVNAQGLVNLQILAEVSQRGANVTVGQDSFPSFDIRQAETTAVVQDGDTLAIGGIIAENKNRDRRGIPYLMDIPVLGRFFGTTSDATRRTELIMLITPHVIRNRGEGTAVTEEFKSRLSMIRNELERMRKDRAQDLEKMKRAWEEQQKAPPLPPTAPASEPPSPAPSSSPAVPTPPVGTFRNINTMPSELPLVPLSQIPQTPVSAVPAALLVSRVEAPQAAATVKQGREPAAPKQLASLPSARTKKEIPSEKVAVKVPRAQATPSRAWAVQVAAFARDHDAESLARKLKDKGYDAYVMVAEVNSKIWHRVRVGQTTQLPVALELRKRLQATENFAQAYVAGR
jgi:general secretion pathway protein D